MILLQAVQTVNSVLPNNLVQLVGWTIMIFMAVYGFVKGWMYAADKKAETEQRKSDNSLELEKTKLLKETEIAKTNQFTAQSVKDMFAEILAVQKELDALKHSSTLKNEHLSSAILHLEKLLEDLSKNLNLLLEKAINH